MDTNKYLEALESHKSERQAAKKLGVSRAVFKRHLQLARGLCIRGGCPNPPEPNRTRCRGCLNACKSKKPKTEIAEKNKQYYWANRDKLLAYNKQYQRENLPRFREARKKYDQTPQGKLSAQRRRLRRQERLTGTLTEADLRLLYKHLPTCAKCGTSEQLTLDHHIPLTKGGQNVIENVSQLCGLCNSKKRNTAPRLFYSNAELAPITAFHSFVNQYQEVGTPKDYLINLNPDRRIARNFTYLHHYSQACPGFSHVFTLEYQGRLLGVCGFSKPSRTNINVPGHANILELSRLVLLPNTAVNSASYFVSKCLAALKALKLYEAVVTFADPTEGHTGSVYKALNFIYLDKSPRNYHYVDAQGVRIHKKQVWDRSKKAQVKESEQALTEDLTKVLEAPKLKFYYPLK